MCHQERIDGQLSIIASSVASGDRDVTTVLTDGDVTSYWHIDHLGDSGKLHYITIRLPPVVREVIRNSNETLCLTFLPRAGKEDNTFRSISLEGSNNRIFWRQLETASVAQTPDNVMGYQICISAGNTKYLRANFLNGWQAGRFYGSSEVLFQVIESADASSLVSVPTGQPWIALRLLSFCSMMFLATSFIVLSTCLVFLSLIIGAPILRTCSLGIFIVLMPICIAVVFLSPSGILALPMIFLIATFTFVSYGATHE